MKKNILFILIFMITASSLFSINYEQVKSFAKEVTPSELENLIQNGFDINEKDNNTGALFYYYIAQFTEYPENIQLIMEYGKDASIPNDAGENILMYAAGYNPNIDVIQELLKYFPINARNRYGHSVLSFACFNSGVRVLDFLIKEGAKVNIRDEHGNTLLHQAIDDDYAEYETIKYLLENTDININAVNDSDKTTLMIACEYPFDDIVNLLLSHGADAKLKTSWGKTAFDYAKEKGALSYTTIWELHDLLYTD